MFKGWEYSQPTGDLYFIDEDGNREYIATGYSGKGEGLNNPDMDHVKDFGPIPRGLWDIGPQRDGGRMGPATMLLTPRPETETYDRERKTFYVHGDNPEGNYSASTRCIILPRVVRNAINNSGVKLLEVIR